MAFCMPRRRQMMEARNEKRLGPLFAGVFGS
jgi:hypothetical protein